MSFTARTCCILGLSSVFVWQSYVSLDKYFVGKVSISQDELYESERVFPSVTFCPILGGNDHRQNVTAWSFEEEYLQLPATNVVRAFSHWHQGRISMEDYEHGLGVPLWNNTWTKYTGMMVENPNITVCEMYTPPPILFPAGPISKAQFFVDTRYISNLMVYINPTPRDFLAPSTMLGVTRLFLPNVSPDSSGAIKTFLFEIVASGIQDLSRRSDPCYDSPGRMKVGYYDCIENYMEGQLGCGLPWRRNANTSNACTDTYQLISYKNLSSVLNVLGPPDIFSLTGCYYNCDYLNFERTLTAQDVSDDEFLPQANYSVLLTLSLCADAMEVYTEKYDFRTDDLVGNIGGFMGLLLGWSLLEIYDFFKEHAEKVSRAKRIKMEAAAGGMKSGVKIRASNL